MRLSYQSMCLFNHGVSSMSCIALQLSVGASICFQCAYLCVCNCGCPWRPQVILALRLWPLEVKPRSGQQRNTGIAGRRRDIRDSDTLESRHSQGLRHTSINTLTATETPYNQHIHRPEEPLSAEDQYKQLQLVAPVSQYKILLLVQKLTESFASETS